MSASAAATSVHAHDAPASPLLQASALFCERDDRVLFSDLNFSLFPGELMQVQGSNGSGKTTLLRILCGLNSSYEGEIYWDGVAIDEDRESFLASLLYIGHRVGVNKILTARENLRWSSALHAPVTDADIDAALGGVGLAGYSDVVCRNMSAGQQQRVSLARLLLSPARLWVLDEPLVGLDAQATAAARALLQSHVDRGGSIVMTSHHDVQLQGPGARLRLGGGVRSA